MPWFESLFDILNLFFLRRTNDPIADLSQIFIFCWDVCLWAEEAPGGALPFLENDVLISAPVSFA